MNTELIQLANHVLEYTTAFVMVDKLQTPQQRRAHEPITQAKRWGASVKIAGMTSLEFGEKFGCNSDIKHHELSPIGGAYTKKQAIANMAESATTEFVRLMTLASYDFENFEQMMEYLNNYNMKAGN
jgi:hypothetical protein